MADYPPPTQILPDFNPAVFRTNDIPLTIAEAENYFVSFPTAQGPVNLGTTNISGTTTFTGNISASGATITPTELSYIDGLTSNAQTQINAKATDADVVHKTGNLTESINGNKTFSGTTTVSGDLTLTNSSTFGTVYGYQATKPTTGTSIHNTAYGYQAGKGLVNTTGSGGNTAFGAVALVDITGASNNNTAIGHYALSHITTGDGNTQVGMTTDALSQNLTTGSQNTLIGHNASVSGNFSNSTAIGHNAQATASNQIVLGTTSETVRYNKLSPFYTALPTDSGDIGYAIATSIGAASNPANNYSFASFGASSQIGVYQITFTIPMSGTFVASSAVITYGGSDIAQFPFVATTGNFVSSGTVACCSGSFVVRTTAVVANNYAIIYRLSGTSTMSVLSGAKYNYTRIA